MNRIQRAELKAKVAANKAEHPPQQAAVFVAEKKPTKMVAQSEPKPVPLVVYRCGHSTPLKVLQEKPCRECKLAANAAKKARKLAKRLAENPPPTTTKPLNAAPLYYDRLPHKASKHLTWDAEMQLWTGIMVVEGCPTFEAIQPSERKCFHALHNLYMRHLAGDKDAAVKE